MFKIEYDLHSRVNKVDINTSDFTYEDFSVEL